MPTNPSPLFALRALGKFRRLMLKGMSVFDVIQDFNDPGQVRPYLPSFIVIVEESKEVWLRSSLRFRPVQWQRR